MSQASSLAQYHSFLLVSYARNLFIIVRSYTSYNDTVSSRPFTHYISRSREASVLCLFELSLVFLVVKERASCILDGRSRILEYPFLIGYKQKIYVIIFKSLFYVVSKFFQFFKRYPVNHIMFVFSKFYIVEASIRVDTSSVARYERWNPIFSVNALWE